MAWQCVYQISGGNLSNFERRFTRNSSNLERGLKCTLKMGIIAKYTFPLVISQDFNNKV